MNREADEVHSYEDARGDTGPRWGVYFVRCPACPKRLAIVTKVDRFGHHRYACREHGKEGSA